MDPNFHRSVVLMITHDDNGAFGLVVNRPSRFTLGELAEGIGESAAAAIPIYVGGPLQQELLFILHSEFPGTAESEHAERPADGVVFEPATQAVVDYLKEEWSPLPGGRPPGCPALRGLRRLGPRPGGRGAEIRGVGRPEGHAGDRLPSRPDAGMGGRVRPEGPAAPDHPADRIQAVHELRPTASPPASDLRPALFRHIPR